MAASVSFSCDRKEWPKWLFTSLEQVTELNSMIMASSYSRSADLPPLRPCGVPPARGGKIVVYSEVEVDMRAVKG